MPPTSRFWIFLILSAAANAAYAARSITMFPMSVSVSDRLTGTGTRAEFTTVVSCQNLSSTSQTLTIEPISPVGFMLFRVLPNTFVAPSWAKPLAFHYCKFNIGGAAIDVGGRTCSGNFGDPLATETVAFQPKGQTNDSREIKYFRACDYNTNGPDCRATSAGYDFEQRRENATGGFVCPAGFTKCVDQLETLYSLRLKLTVAEDRGAMLCSVTNAVILTGSRSPVGVPETVPINGGRPF